MLPRRSHDTSRSAVFQAMLAWGAGADERSAQRSSRALGVTDSFGSVDDERSAEALESR